MTKVAVDIGKLADKEHCEELVQEDLQWEGVSEDLLKAVEPFAEADR